MAADSTAAHAAHQHTPDVNFAEHADKLQEGADLWSDVTARIAAELPVPDGAVVADVGCGTGGMALRLARRLRPSGGRVLAVDREEALLDRVRRRAEAEGLGDTVQTVHAQVQELPGALPTQVSLVWAGHVVHHAGDQAGAIAALAAALSPGGVLAVNEGGLPPRSLPWDVGVGRPGLEIRLTVAVAEWLAAMRADLPGSVRDPRGWPAILSGVGLHGVTARSYLLDRPAPLEPAVRDVVIDRLEHAVERGDRWLDAEDREAWRRLLDRDDEAWLGNRDDLQFVAVDTVHLGHRQ
jgi:SAM-dependent methyltransferase